MTVGKAKAEWKENLRAHRIAFATTRRPSSSREMSVRLKIDAAGLAIDRINLVTRAKVPGIDEGKFLELANTAKAGCPVSKALAAVDIHLDAALEG